MSALSTRKEPVIAFGVPSRPAVAPLAAPRRIIPAPRHVPTGDLTRSIRRAQDADRMTALCRTLALSRGMGDLLRRALLSLDGDEVGDAAIAMALDAVFDFEPIVSETPHPVMLVGGDMGIRQRAALSLAQRMERSGRRVALYHLHERQFPEPIASYTGGLNILNIGSVEECVDAVRARDAGEMAVIDASCLDGAAVHTNALSMLSLSLGVESVLVGDGRTPLPDRERSAGIERLVIAGRCSPERLGTLLTAAYNEGWAFGGQCTAAGLYHPMTSALLVDRVALSVH